CKKQTIVATSTTKAEYVTAANCYGQNPVFYSKTKHIEIRHHFIRDAYEKKLIQVLKIHTDDNVADLLTKAFDVSRFNFLIVNNGMMNLKLHWFRGSKMLLLLEVVATADTNVYSASVGFYHHTKNGHQFTMSNIHQELASPEQTASGKELASPKQTDLGKDISNPLIVDSLLKTIWLSMHHVITIKHWLF
ncbi:putative ribonuclease H-like domain-containing protein, partial [Tanacetum coccineum]